MVRGKGEHCGDNSGFNIARKSESLEMSRIQLQIKQIEQGEELNQLGFETKERERD